MPLAFSRNARRLGLFLLLTAVSLGLILILTVNDKTAQALARMRPQFIVLCLAAWIAAYALDALSNVLFVKGGGGRIGWPDAVRLTAVRIFFNLITPLSSGGQPVSVYILHSLGIQAGKGTSIIVARLSGLSLITTLSAIVSFLLFGPVTGSNGTVRAAFFGTGIAITCVYAFLVFSLLCLPFLEAVMRLAGKLLFKIRAVKDPGAFASKAVGHVVTAAESLKGYFTKHPLLLIAGLLSCAAWYACQVFILHFIILGLGIEVSLATSFALGSLLFFTISFMPTPGGTGFGEFLFLVLFAGTVELELAGIAVVAWRIFYQYLSSVLGAIFTARYFSWIWAKSPNA